MTHSTSWPTSGWSPSTARMARPWRSRVSRSRRAGRGGDQGVVAVEQVGHAALADRHAAPVELAMDFRHAAVFAVAQGADQSDHVQAKLMLRQRQGALGLRPPCLMVAPAGPVLAVPDLEAQAHQSPQRHHGPAVGVADPHRAPALRAGLLDWNQDSSSAGFTRHQDRDISKPSVSSSDTFNRQPVLPF